jgi:hypothetical protein
LQHRKRKIDNANILAKSNFIQGKRKIFVGVEHLRHHLATLHHNLHLQMLYPLCFYRQIIPAFWGLSVNVKGLGRFEIWVNVGVFGQSIPNLR